MKLPDELVEFRPITKVDKEIVQMLHFGWWGLAGQARAPLRELGKTKLIPHVGRSAVDGHPYSLDVNITIIKDVYAEYSINRSIEEVTDQSLIGFLEARQISHPLVFPDGAAAAGGMSLMDSSVSIIGDKGIRGICSVPLVGLLKEPFDSSMGVAVADMAKVGAEAL